MCDQWLASRRSARVAICTTWPIVYELARVVTHPGVLVRPLTVSAVFDFVDELTRSAGFEMLVGTPEHSRVARHTIRETPNVAGNIMHDFHTVVLMREHGVRQICTRDADFRRFPGIEVIDPVRG